ncbi:MAG: NADP-dependent isocitrate dehydrogenase [Cytophagales bacterium]|nr:NADP-dependent isocitrate dehydrogenase [Cytophagales bacterium]
MLSKTPILVAEGDGIGPEIMRATLRILEAAEVQIEPQFIEIGEKVYLNGYPAGIRQEAWDALRSTKVFLKAPITTPQGSGYKSLNVTIRKTLGLFANVRLCKSFHPYIRTKHPKLDLVIIRENEEDLYAGIEHRQTQEVMQSLKLVSRPGSEKIVRYAFEYTQACGRKKITCLVKDNIMKLTDGVFHEVFKEIGKEYPAIEQEVKIVDIGSALIADTPEQFDVVIASNLYGDIVSDIAAQLTGSLGLAGSANIGEPLAMFEAIHGSAPDIAGKNIANPSALLNAAVMMLVHIGQPAEAEKIYNAWLATIEDGIHTRDIYQEGVSKQLVGTSSFTDAVIARLGKVPQQLEQADFSSAKMQAITFHSYERKYQSKELVGADVFLHWEGSDPNELGKRIEEHCGTQLRLQIITNRGIKVYPNGFPETFCTDHWRCRFLAKSTMSKKGKTHYLPVDYASILALLNRLYESNIAVIKTENLYTFDGVRGFSLGQGE